MQVDQRQQKDTGALSFGESLRRERQLRDISLREVAAATKISITYLEALERNDFDALPGGAFNKGFLRAYAAHVGLDPEEMVNAYLFESARRRQAGESESPEAKAGPGWRWLIPVLVLAGAATAAAAWWLLG